MTTEQKLALLENKIAKLELENEMMCYLYVDACHNGADKHALNYAANKVGYKLNDWDVELDAEQSEKLAEITTKFIQEAS